MNEKSTRRPLTSLILANFIYNAQRVVKKCLSGTAFNLKWRVHCTVTLL